MPTKDISVLAIIPARGGSKGVKRKNIRLLNGLPLIAYSIKSAHESQYLSDVVVSSDDKEILAVAAEYNANTLARPDELATDTAPMLPVLQHTLKEMETKTSQTYDYIAILQPTAPFRTAKDIDTAVESLNGAKSLVSVYKVEDCHPARMYTIENEQLLPVMPEPPGALRQDLPNMYHRNGCIYLIRRDTLVDDNLIISKDSKPYIMSERNSVNIDTEFDLEIAEFLMQKENE